MYNLYLISCGEGHAKKYKIGYTKNKVEDRIKQLKTGNSETLIIEQVYQTKWATRIESILHKNFKNQRISGEWFNLDDDQVSGFLKECRSLENFLEYWKQYSTYKNPEAYLSKL